MKPELQRITIAEACGWGEPNKNMYANTPKTWAYRRDKIPDYLNDLNAMHEAEKVCLRIKHEQGDDYAYYDSLVIVTKNLNPIHATATQRARAFLETLDLWKP